MIISSSAYAPHSVHSNKGKSLRMIITDRFTLKGRSLTARVIEALQTWHFMGLAFLSKRWLIPSLFPGPLIPKAQEEKDGGLRGL
jgi:hypothetical protein